MNPELKQQIKRNVTLVRYYCNRPGREHGLNTSDHYDTTFQPLLKGKSIANIVAEKRNIQGEALVLDLMGFGKVLRPLPITAGLAVALTDTRNKNLQEEDTQRNISLITGNILRGSTWNRTSEWLELQGNDKKFDIILCRPIGGIQHIPDNKDIYYYLMQKMWDRLSNNNGILLTQTPPPARHMLEAWVKKARQSGIGTEYQLTTGLTIEDYDILRLIKKPTSHVKLPVLEEDIPFYVQPGDAF